MAFQKKKSVQFVIKSSKFCNLRCRYCYEYAELGNRDAIPLEQLDQMYKNIASYYSKLEQPIDIQFIWHGGEPLLHQPSYYWQTFDRQQQIFEPLVGSVTNTAQTNLTVLNEERLRLLKEGFDAIGVSVDLFGGLRTNRSGVDSQPTVLANIERLLAEKISFGCITVLTKLNLPYIKDIYNFYDTRRISFRILPLFSGAFEEQHQGYKINADEVVSALCTLFDLWLSSKNPVKIEPIIGYIQQIIHYYTPKVKPNYYNKREWESIYMVNVNGDVYSYADAYNVDFCHGNLFTTPLEQLVSGDGHQKAIAAAERRMASACHSCSYFGSCSGYPVAEESVGYNHTDEKGNAYCLVEKGILQYIERRFKQVGIINPITNRFNIKPKDSLESIPSLSSIA
ncbi:MAG: radical SAM protein [Aphanothece sp. CMT-3BRIN-NPC111]|jgi:uncharacterized protein|nr:radical SAM protein [Aphanothece sp. CMT-3BRIN-NPC111]